MGTLMPATVHSSGGLPNLETGCAPSALGMIFFGALHGHIVS